MRKAFVAIIALAIFFAGASGAFASGLAKAQSKNPEAQKLIDKAWAMEKAEISPAVYKQCILLLEQANTLDPMNHDILVTLARYHWQYGDELPKATPEQQKMLQANYAKGLAYAEKAFQIKETSAAHFWIAVNKAAGLEWAGIMQQAGAFPTIYKHSNWVTDHDPNYYYGSTGRLWTEIVTRVPRKVVEIIGMNYINELLKQIDDSIKDEPRYMDNYVYKARFVNTFYGAAKKDEALKLLETALKMDVNIMPEEVAANKKAQQHGRELWKQITGKDYPQR